MKNEERDGMREIRHQKKMEKGDGNMSRNGVGKRVARRGETHDGKRGDHERKRRCE